MIVFPKKPACFQLEKPPAFFIYGAGVHLCVENESSEQLGVFNTIFVQKVSLFLSVQAWFQAILGGNVVFISRSYEGDNDQADIQQYTLVEEP